MAEQIVIEKQAEEILNDVEKAFKDKSHSYQDGFKSGLLYICSLFRFRKDVASDVKATIADLKGVEWAWKTQDNDASKELYKGFSQACEKFVPSLRKNQALGPEFFSRLFSELIGLSDRWVTFREDARKPKNGNNNK